MAVRAGALRAAGRDATLQLLRSGMVIDGIGRGSGVGLLLAMMGCGATPAGTAVKQYVDHLRGSNLEAAYQMLSTEAKARYDFEAYQGAMHTEVLADVQDLSVKGLQILSPGGTCVYTQLDFASLPDEGPYGHYTFYLTEEDDVLRIRDVLTYDRIEGDGLVKTGHFDESREPFPCSSRRP